jgi:hypothetical protein
MGFEPCNCLLKIRESIGSPIPKMGVHLGMWGFIPSHSFALLGAWNVTLELPSWPTTLQALALVANPRLGLQHLWTNTIYVVWFSTIQTKIVYNLTLFLLFCEWFESCFVNLHGVITRWKHHMFRLQRGWCEIASMLVTIRNVSLVNVQKVNYHNA